MTRTKLEKKHGTPAEFAKAVWAAHADMTITVHEATAAIQDYEREWTDAFPSALPTRRKGLRTVP